MKVLFVTRPYIGLSEGGLHRQIRRTGEALRNRNIEVIYCDQWKNQIREVDLCHFFSTNSQMYYHVIEAKKQSKPIVISPVFGNSDMPFWKGKLKLFLARRVPGFCYHLVLLKEILDIADRIIALNDEEAVRLHKFMQLSWKRMRIVPNGVDRRFAEGDPDMSRRHYGIKDIVLQVGSIDPNKNQLTVIKAMKNLPYTYIIVGKVLYEHSAYLQKCRAAAGDNVLFLGQLDYDDPMLTSVYAAARVFILPSFREVMPLCVLEAALAGCRIIISRNIPVNAILDKYVKRANPNNPREFRTLIQNAMTMPRKQDEGSILNVQSLHTWQDVADQIINIYEEVLDEN